MKTIFRKPLALIMSLLLLSSISTSVIAATPASDYVSNWAKETIQLAFSTGIVHGYPDGTFKPDNNITRAEFFELTNNVFSFTSEDDVTYSDVSSHAWYSPVIAKAIAAGYVEGYPDGTIKPDGKITRQEVAVIINRLRSLNTGSDTLTFSDAPSIGDWSKQAVMGVSGAKIMIGYPDGSFKPEAQITRAEALVATTRAQAAVNAVNLGLASNYVILAKTGISTVPNSVITGNIGVSPIDATALTGFSLTEDATKQFSNSTQIIGKAYASNYTSPTPENLTTAMSNMETAYTDAAGRAANYTELYSGDLSGKTLTAGVYKWGTGVLINSDVTLHGNANDVWIFQISEGITQASNTKIILTGGAQAKNVFWQTAATVSIGTGSHFEGNILSMTNIALSTNASITGRLFAQTAVTLDASTVVTP